MTLPAFTTRRLDLAPATRDDLDSVWRIWRHPDVCRYLFDGVPVTRERADEVLTDALDRRAVALGLWTVRLRVAASAVGTVALLRATTIAAYDPSLAGAVEVLAAFEPPVWGRGYATEALEAVIGYAFGALGLLRLVAVVDVPNEASHRMVGRLGFMATGECAGPRHPLRLYSLTASGFAGRPSRTAPTFS